MSNVVKPTIPAEVADAIEELRVRADSESILYSVLNDPTADISVDALRTIPFDTLLAALVNGYERELTEEERANDAIKREWLRRDAHRQRVEYCDGFADGIEFVLGELSVLIEGVNA